MNPAFETLECRTLLAAGALIPPATAPSRPPSRHALTAAAAVAQSWTLKSPDAQLTSAITLDTAGRLTFKLDRPAGAHVLDASPLGVTLTGAGGDFTTALQFVSQTSRTIDETFALLTGKSSASRNRANEI